MIPMQGAEDRKTFETMLQAGRVNSTNPFGSSQWSRGPEGQWNYNESLSPQQQGLYDQDMRIQGNMGNVAEGMLGNVKNAYGQPQNFAGQFKQGGPIWDEGARGRAEDAIYGRHTRMLDKQYGQAEDRLHECMVGQGFNTQDAGYADSMDKFGQQRDRAYADARDQAIIGGGQEGQNEFNRGLMGGQFAREGQLQGINLQQQDRSRLLNELNAFRTGGQIQNPNINAQYGTPNLPSQDHIGAARMGYQDQLAGWNAQQGSKDAFMGGLFGLGSAAIGKWSDVRLKKDLQQIGTTKDGRNLYAWNWKDGGQGFGIVAQENLDVAIQTPSGYYKVDYSKVDM
jgi:hypothetical protein